MKKLILSTLLVIISLFTFAQEEPLGLLGDNLNLYSVLNLFQRSETLEIFEKNLNLQNSKINNLDLNIDGRTDYIHVIDHVNGYTHAIVLKVNINQYETQDVAVIEVEKINNQIHIQIIGDEALYGKDYIVEPNDQTTSNPGYEYIPVSSWLIFSYMYNPYYIGYSSPYYWGYYPYYWNPWSPMYYDAYYSYHRPYYNYYRRGYYYRSPVIHKYYSPYRNTSPTIYNRRGGAYQTPHQYRPSNMNHPSNYPSNMNRNRNNNPSQPNRPNNYHPSQPNKSNMNHPSQPNRSSGVKHSSGKKR
jgi:hypothetical protein